MTKKINKILSITFLVITISILVNNSILPQDNTDWYWTDASGGKGTKKELEKMLYSHKLWLDSDRKQGGRADLRNTVLSNVDFLGYDLRKIDFSNSDLRKAKFKNSRIGAAIFRNCKLSYTDFSSATTDFDIEKSRTIFTNASLAYTNFTDANLEGAMFSDVVFQNTDFNGAIIDRTVLFGTDFTNAINFGKLHSSKLVHIDSDTKVPAEYFFDSSTQTQEDSNIEDARKTQPDQNTSFNIFDLISDVFPYMFAGFIASVLISLVYSFYKQKKTLNQDEKEISNKIQSLESGVKEEKTLLEYIETLLMAAGEKQRLTMLKSEGRSNWLYRIGTSLMTFTIAIPFITVYIYFQDILIEGDWHILAAGVSFSLIFLAAARGLMNQHSTQREIYFLLSERVSYYLDLINALKIAKKLDTENNSNLTAESVETLIKNLISNVGIKSKFKSNFSEEDESENSIIGFIKDLITKK